VLLGASKGGVQVMGGVNTGCDVQNTICGNTRSCCPDDGHNDARNMLG